jgi:hypothetical protein
MMGFIRRLLISDIHPTEDEHGQVEETKRELDQTRGEYRQTVLRVAANMRVMKTWENANRMVRE